MATQSNDQGSFLVGLGCGMVAGAFGYFLFATHKGEKIRQELAQEWELAAQEVSKHSSQHEDQVVGTLKGALYSFISSLAGEANQTPARAAKADHSPSKEKAESPAAKSVKAKRPVAKKTDTKFKGI